jgi:hypothetical protein
VGILAGIFVLRHPLLTALTVPTVPVFILGVHVLVMGCFTPGHALGRGYKHEAFGPTPARALEGGQLWSMGWMRWSVAKAV